MGPSHAQTYTSAGESAAGPPPPPPGLTPIYALLWLLCNCIDSVLGSQIFILLALHSLPCALNFVPFQPFHLKLYVENSRPMAQEQNKKQNHEHLFVRQLVCALQTAQVKYFNSSLELYAHFTDHFIPKQLIREAVVQFGNKQRTRKDCARDHIVQSVIGMDASVLSSISISQDHCISFKQEPKITSQRLLDQSQAGVYRGKRHILPPILAFLGLFAYPTPRG